MKCTSSSVDLRVGITSFLRYTSLDNNLQRTMRLHASSLVGLAWTLSAVHTTDAATCKTLSDPTSTLVKSIASVLGTDVSNIPVATTFSEIDQYFSWLSTCAAAVDPVAAYASIAASNTLKNCLSTLGEFNSDLITKQGWSDACPTLNDTVIPCVEAAMTEVVMDVLNSTGSCCDGFLSEIKTMFGDSLDDMVKNIVNLGANAVCSERTFTNLKSAVANEMCGYSIINSLTFLGSDDDGTTLLNLAQIPNNQMCDAFDGKSFKNTKSGTATIGFGTNDVDTMGICLQPVDELLQYLASWPIFSKTLDAAGASISLSNLFTSSMSLRGSLLLAYATTSTNMPLIFLRALDKLFSAMSGDSGSSTGSQSASAAGVVEGFLSFAEALNSYATALLLHIPNGGDCTYSDQSITKLVGATTTTADAMSSAPTLQSLMAVSVVVLSSLVMMALL